MATSGFILQCLVLMTCFLSSSFTLNNEENCEYVEDQRAVVCSNGTFEELPLSILQMCNESCENGIKFVNNSLLNLSDNFIPEMKSLKNKIRVSFVGNDINKLEIGERLLKNEFKYNVIHNLSAIILRDDTNDKKNIDLDTNIIQYISPDVWSPNFTKYLNYTCRYVYMHMSQCNLTQIPNGISDKLFFFSLSRNNFTRIPHRSFVGSINRCPYSDLLLDNSEISIIENGAFDNFITNLLNLSHNNIKSLSSESFINSNIEILDVSHNKIHSLDRNLFWGLGKDLRKVYLRHNLINTLESYIFKNNTGLKFLDLRDNPLIKIEPDAFMGLNYIRNDRLSQRNALLLQGIELIIVEPHIFNGLKSLKTLDLSYGKIEEICPGSFIELQELLYLDVSHNSIKNIEPDTFAELKYIEDINLSNNEIINLDLKSFYIRHPHNYLSSIDLSFNKIKRLQNGLFAETTLLSQLNFSNNYISVVENELLAGPEYSYMTFLDFSYNNIKVLDKKLFYSLPALKKLYVNNNNITQLDVQEILLHSTELKVITINNNPWSCTLLQEMIQILTAFKVDFLNNTMEHNYGSQIYGISCRNNTINDNEMQMSIESLRIAIERQTLYQMDTMNIMLLGFITILVTVIFVVKYNSKKLERLLGFKNGIFYTNPLPNSYKY